MGYRGRLRCLECPQQRVFNAVAPKSGKMQEFLEVDSACWFSLEVAYVKITPARRDFLDQLSAVTLAED
jgi:predicted NUDIX family NTP pyrophosphohydrolase